MKTFAILPIGLGFALAACGGNETAEEGAETATAAAVMAQPGEYRTTAELTDLNVPGTDAGQLEQIRAILTDGLSEGKTFCLVAQNADESGRELARQLAEGDCSVENFTLDGGALNAAMMCSIDLGNGTTSDGPVSVEGTVREQASSMTVAMDQVMPGANGSEMTANMIIQMDSQRIGDCTADVGT